MRPQVDSVAVTDETEKTTWSLPGDFRSDGNEDDPAPEGWADGRWHPEFPPPAFECDELRLHAV